MATACKPLAAGAVVLWLILGANAVAAEGVQWLPGTPAPGTPARYDKVGVLKIGSVKAKNVLVLVPGTIKRRRTYAHNDPNGAYPHNLFFAHLIPFLARVAAGRG